MRGSMMELRAAVRRNDLEGIRREVAADPDGLLRLPDSPRVLEDAAGDAAVGLETLRALVEAGARTNDGVGCAAKTGDLERVKFFESLGGSLSGEDQHGYTPLHWALLHGKPPIYDLVTYLLDAGVDPDRRSVYGETAMGHALNGNQIEIARLLLDRGATKNDPEWPKILTAVIWRDFDGIDRHRDELKTDFFRLGLGTPLQVAMRMGDLELVRVLADRGADLQLEDPGGYTLFHTSLTEGSIPVIEWCAEHVCGGKMGKKHLHGAHQAAIRSGRIPAAQWLFDHGVPMTEEYSASPLHSCWTPEMADFYLANGEGIDAFSGDGYWVLALAAEEGDVTMAAHWIRRGANVNRAWNGTTALHYAVRADSDAVVDLLIGAGADINAQDGDGETPLGQARSLSVARKLLAAGANLDLKNDVGQRVDEGLLGRDETFRRLFRKMENL